MKFYLISDNIDTQMGMRLAGVEGEVANEIASKIKETADCKVTVSQNRRIQSTGIIGIYFCGE